MVQLPSRFLPWPAVALLVPAITPKLRKMMKQAEKTHKMAEMMKKLKEVAK